MKNRTRKKRLSEHAAKARKLPTQFLMDTRCAEAEARAGKLTRYQLNAEDRAWLDMAPVGREWGSLEFDAAQFLDSEETIAAYLADIVDANNPSLLEAARYDIARAR